MPAAAVTAPTTGPPMRKPAPAAVTADDVAMFSSFTGTSAVDDSARRDIDRAADAADGAWNAEAVLRAASASRSLAIVTGDVARGELALRIREPIQPSDAARLRFAILCAPVGTPHSWV